MSNKIKDILSPKLFKDLIGSKKLLYNNSFLDRIIKNKKLYSLIFYGNPGSGKTTISKVLCNELKLRYKVFNASIDNKQKLIEILNDAYVDVIIVDEIHRLNKDKQDILLPYLEDSRIKMLATTTENPFFYINPAIRSRCQLIEIKQNDYKEIASYIIDKLSQNDIKLKITDDLINKICRQLNSDLRSIILIFDILYNLYSEEEITSQMIDTLLLTKSNSIVNRDGDEIHNLKSAFHKSMRGSDVDASLHYLARLIKLQDIQIIERRIIGCLYEDIGLANPNLALRVLTNLEAAHKVGFPEACNILATCVVEVAISPKSNAIANAMFEAMQDVNKKDYKIPNHLKDNHYKSASKLGIDGYVYPLDFEKSYVKQQYLPDNFPKRNYYRPRIDSKAEVKLNEWIKNIKKELE